MPRYHAKKKKKKKEWGLPACSAKIMQMFLSRFLVFDIVALVAVTILNVSYGAEGDGSLWTQG